MLLFFPVVAGMNIRMPQANQAVAPDSSSGPPPPIVAGVTGNNAEALQSNEGPGPVNQMPGFPDGASFGPPVGMPVWAPHGIGPGGIHPTPQGPPQEEESRSVSTVLEKTVSHQTSSEQVREMSNQFLNLRGHHKRNSP